MQNVPSTAELVEAVAEWLEGPAGAALTGAERFNARVAANVLRSVEREVRAGVDHHAADRDAFRKFVPADERPDTDDALVSRVADRVRAGELDDHIAELLATFRGYTIRKLLVTNPKYLRADDQTATC